ncbi:probable 28S ribosomal protein S6, mitochondrial [Trichonephila clavipes]|uniref:Small ribosomal subunit protein bS6m n=1 Tax=Trichonephila clavipes TaxID=2585209 RepID=A0A8X7BBA9_TRICX|nr:probable 28S ribosomal protein S6, mitochondrial [Trichonephila clavipes]
MPAYEFSVLVKVLPKPELSAVLKRVGILLLDKGVVLQKIQNVGTTNLPYRIRKEGVYYKQGSYFAYAFTGSPKIFADVEDACVCDPDILKYGFVETYKKYPESCTLEEELRPPAFRTSVLKLLEDGKKRKERARPFYRHIKEYNYFDVYM